MRSLGNCERLERIDHDRQLVGRGLAETRLHGAGLRTVRCARGVQCDRALLDAAAAHEVAVDVVEDFVAIDARVIVRNRYGERMIVEHPRNEDAKRRARRLEGRMRGRRLMEFPGDRCVFVGVEGVGVAVAIPADQIEGVILDQIDGIAAGVRDSDLVFAARFDRVAEDWTPEVPLVIGRVLGELPEIVAELLGNGDVPARAMHDQPRRHGGAKAVDRPGRHDEVVMRPID